MHRQHSKWINLLFALVLLVQSFVPVFPAQTTAATTQTTTPRPQDVRPALERSSFSSYFADLNGDQRVDDSDLALIGQAWNCAAGDGCYTADFDFNNDGLIDIFDLAAVGNEYDIEPPQIEITSPDANAVLTGPTITVEGTAADSHEVTSVLVNGTAASLTPSGQAISFTAVISAPNGALPIHVAAVDAIGQSSSQSRLVVIDGEGPYITVHAPPNRQAVYTLRPTVNLAFVDLVSTVEPTTAQVTLTDESGAVTDITAQLTIDQAGAEGTLNFDLQIDESYTLTASIQDSAGNVGNIATTFYIPPDPESISPPTAIEGAGFVSGIVYDSSTCDGELLYDPINCTGIAGAFVTLELIDPDALAAARLARTTDLAAADSAFGLPATASKAPAPFAQTISGTIVTGPDGFFAFPVAATGSYAVRVEKQGFTYGQRLTDIVLERSAPTTDIFLTPLDPAVTSCDITGCQHASDNGQMQLDIPAGAIPPGETLDVQATQFDQVQFLPSGELPPGTGETYAFNLSGATEITFTQPITVRVKNDRGFAPGTPVPLGYWNQTLQVWEHAGTAEVDPTGQWLVMAVTHFSNFDPNDPVSNATAEISGVDQTNKPGESCVSDCDSSQIELDSGALRQSFSLPTANTLAGAMGVAMLYDSTRANPTAVIDLAINIEALTELGLGEFDLLMAELFIEGQSAEQFSFQVNELEQDGEIGRFRFFWDGRDAQGRQLPPGVYFYNVRVKIPYTAEYFFSLDGRFGGPPDLSRPTGVTTIGMLDTFVSGTVLLNGQPENFYGHGWQVADVQRLYFNEDGSAMIDDGAHTQTSYLIPRFDLLPGQPLAVQTLDTRLEASAVQGMASVISNTEEPGVASLPSTGQLTNPEPDTQPAVSAFAPTLTPITDDIITDTVWTLAGSPYEVQNDITVVAGVTLTVEAGVVVSVFGATTDINVQGNLLTQGTLADPVIFTSAANDPGNDGGAEWGRIFINGGTADLDFTTIRYGGNILAATTTNRAVLAVNNGSLNLTNSLLFRNGDTDVQDDAFLHSENSATLIDNSVLTHDGLTNANPRRGINVVGEGGSFVMTNSVVEHRFNPLRLPINHLAGVDQSNTFSTDLAIARIELTGSTLTSDLTISPLPGIASYYFFNSLTVAVGSALTLTAGVKFQAQNNINNNLVVNGRLVAQGTAQDNVVFTSQLELGNQAEWGGIFIDGGTADIEFATIRFGGRLVVPDPNTGATLAVRNGELRLANSLLFRNGDTDVRDDAPLYIVNSIADISGNVITQDGVANANPAYGLILVDGGSMALTFSDNIIDHPFRPLRTPLALLPAIEDTNHFTNDNDQRIGFTDTTIAGQITLGPVAGVTNYERLANLTVTGALLVEAGVTLRSQQGVLTVNGGFLQADGTAEAPVTLERQGAGTWPGIVATNGAVIRLSHTQIRQAALGINATNSHIYLLNGRFTNNTRFLRLNAGAVPGFFARGNEFDNNSISAVENFSGVLVDMRLNYWGSANGPVHPANPGGDGEVILGGADVLIDPFLLGGALEGNTAVNLTPHDATLLVFDPDTATFTRHYPDGMVVEFNVGGLHTVTRDRNGNEIRYSYNGDNSLASIGFVASGEDTADWLWTFAYQSSLQGDGVTAVTITDPAGRVTTLEIDQHGRLTSWQEPGLDAPMTFAYGSLHNMTHKTDARGHTTTYEYDEMGRITRSLLPPREVFDPITGQFGIAQETHDFAPSVVNAPLVNELPVGSPTLPNPPLVTTEEIASTQAINGRLYSHTTNQFGAHTGYIDPLGNAVIIERDERDRITKTVSAEGNCITYTYDEFDNILTMTEMDAAACQGIPGLTRTTTYTYEPLFNQVKTMTDPLGRTTAYVYDYEAETGDSGNLVKVIYPQVEDENGVLVTPEETYSYNNQGQMTQLVDERGIVTCFGYTTGDPGEAGTIFAPGVTPVPGLLTQVIEDCGGALERVSAYSQFDAAGNAQQFEEPFNGTQTRQTNFLYDARSRLVQQTDPLDGVDVMSYDNGDNLTQIVLDVTGRPLTITFTYNPINQPLTEVHSGEGEAIATRLAYDLNRQLTFSQDSSGNVTTYQYDAANRLVRVTNALGHTAEYSYDGDGRLTELIDRRGTPTTFTYDGLNRLIAQTFDPAGLNLVSQASYDLADNALTSADANGVVTCMAYDNWNRLTSLTADCGGLNAVSSLEYNLDGMTTGEIDPLGRKYSYGFDRLNRPVTMTDPLGQIFQTTYDPGDHVVAETDMLGRVTTYGYDLRHRQTTMTNPLGGVTAYGYDSRNNLVSLTDELGRASQMAYDVFGRLVHTIDATGAAHQMFYNDNGNLVEDHDALGRVTRYEYDALNRLVRQIDPLGDLYTTVYDANDNPTAVSDPLGHTGQMLYDTADRLVSLTDPLGQATLFGYDNVGNQTQVINPLGHTSQMSYDNLYRLTQLVNPNGETTAYSHNLVSNLLTYTDPLGNVTTLNYDALDRLVSQTNQSGNMRTFTYDAVGNQTGRTDGNGRTRTFTFDALNRLTGETWVGDPGGYAATFSYDAAGQMFNATDSFAGYTFTYDGVGRLLSRNETVAALAGNAADVNFTFAYDAVGNMNQIVEEINGTAGATTTTLFDALNRPMRLQQEGPGVLQKRVDFQFDAASRLTGLARFTDLAGAQQVVNSQYSYDAENKLTSINHQPNGGPALNYTYTYDTADRLLQLNSPDGGSSFTYDDFDQLLTAVHSFQSNENYNYDDNGNRTNHTTGPDNRLLNDGAFTYAYDGEGNRISKTHDATGFVTEYAWDYRQRLTQVANKDNLGNILSSVAYTYNVFDERIGRADSAGLAQQFAVLNGSVQLVFDGAGALTNRYLHGSLIDMALVDEQVGGTMLYPLADHQMTARDLLDGSGAVVNHRTFDSFGNLTGESNPAVDYLFGYTGREADEVAGISYYRARYYDAAVGKFLNEDPIGLLGSDANLSRYVGNSPIRFGDPSGLLDMDFFTDGVDAVKNSVDEGLEFFADNADDAARIATDRANAVMDFAQTLAETNNIPVKDIILQHDASGNLIGAKLPKAAVDAWEAERAALQAAANAQYADDVVSPNLLQKGLGELAKNAEFLGVAGAVADYAEVVMHVGAELYIAQARIMAHERVERHREEMERRMLALRREEIRKHNEEVRQRQAKEREERNAEILRQQQQEKELADIVNQVIKEAEERRKRGGSSLGQAIIEEGFQPDWFQRNLDRIRAGFNVVQGPNNDAPVVPPGNNGGLIGFLNYLAEKHGVGKVGGQMAGTPGDDCFPR